MIKEFLEITKDILSYWLKEVLEKGFYFLIAIVIILFILCVNNPYGRYLDSWLN